MASLQTWSKMEVILYSSACCGCSIACLPATSLNVCLLGWLLRFTSLGTNWIWAITEAPQWVLYRYGGCIPPVRNDLHSAFIHMLKCKEGEARNAIMTSSTPNCILLPYDTRKEGALILREFKTQDRANPKLYNRRLGLGLSDEIRASLQQHPRDYLFTEARSIRPYTHGGFQQYASRTLKALFGKPCTLTLLRHSYISHMLAYGKLSIKDKEELAQDMCHSVETQAQYQFISP